MWYCKLCWRCDHLKNNSLFGVSSSTLLSLSIGDDFRCGFARHRARQLGALVLVTSAFSFGDTTPPRRQITLPRPPRETVDHHCFFSFLFHLSRLVTRFSSVCRLTADRRLCACGRLLHPITALRLPYAALHRVLSRDAARTLVALTNPLEAVTRRSHNLCREFQNIQIQAFFSSLFKSIQNFFLI